MPLFEELSLVTVGKRKPLDELLLLFAVLPVLFPFVFDSSAV